MEYNLKISKKINTEKDSKPGFLCRKLRLRRQAFKVIPKQTEVGIDTDGVLQKLGVVDLPAEK